ncbi:nucleoside deaminase [Stieleria sp. JC731]|uniref:nucleoside deaminase n=1 Tax=Pirellulaceae TaxID=2691357 RepID=UPI001E2E5F70|nr:nucleoside deaminase [Stieleria sp. JC731]MCC9601743.1 nucleoside deaminase [Stieleria sp. JC731]
MKIERVEDRMLLAIKAAEIGIALGQSPFGAAIFSEDGKPLAIVHNQVKSLVDPSGHAEVIAIRTACAKLGQGDLSGYQLVSTCEPCPMCASTIVFAGIRNVVFGADVSDAKQAGFGLLQIPSKIIFDQLDPPMDIVGGVSAELCRQLFSKNNR